MNQTFTNGSWPEIWNIFFYTRTLVRARAMAGSSADDGLLQFLIGISMGRHGPWLRARFTLGYWHAPMALFQCEQ